MDNWKSCLLLLKLTSSIKFAILFGPYRVCFNYLFSIKYSKTPMSNRTNNLFLEFEHKSKFFTIWESVEYNSDSYKICQIEKWVRINQHIICLKNNW